MPPTPRRRNSYGYLQDSARDAADHFTETPKGIRIDLRLYVYTRDHGNSVIVRDDSGTEQTHIRIDKPTEAVVALAAIWEEASKTRNAKPPRVEVLTPRRISARITLRACESNPAAAWQIHLL